MLSECSNQKGMASTSSFSHILKDAGNKVFYFNLEEEEILEMKWNEIQRNEMIDLFALVMVTYKLDFNLI